MTPGQQVDVSEITRPGALRPARDSGDYLAAWEEILPI
jgi:hypothetical protein